MKNVIVQKTLLDKLVEECTETKNKLKLVKIILYENENTHKRSSCTLYIVLFPVISSINVGTGSYFVYYKYMNRNEKTDLKEKCYFLGKNY